MPQLYGLLQMPWIERPPLGAANTPSIRQRSCTALAVAGQTLFLIPETDLRFSYQLSQGVLVVQVLISKPQQAFLCHSSILMALYGCVSSGPMGRTSTRSDLTPPCQLNNLLRQNS